MILDQVPIGNLWFLKKRVGYLWPSMNPSEKVNGGPWAPLDLVIGAS